jgi:putative DNA methylase
MELAKNLDGDEVLRHLALNTPDWYADSRQRDLAIELAGYLASQLETLRPDEASAARVLRKLVRNQRVG